MNKRTISWNEYQSLVNKICRDIGKSNWRPDYVVGITRGGLLPAVMISHYFDIPCHTLKVCLRDHNDTESNLWMAEDAYGHKQEKTINNSEDIGEILSAASELLEEGEYYKNILLVDDINDSGATFNWIMDDWRAGCFPDDSAWDDNIWNMNVKFAVLFDNLASRCNVKMDFVGEEVNKAENDIWLDFPYEEWWAK